jgi:hypothetical protein
MSHRILLAAALLVLAGAPATARTADAAPPAPKAPAKPAARASAARTLEDVHIEGEIPVPQVLFITARDQRRFMDSHHRRYLKSSRQLGEETPYPTWVALVRNRPAVPGKEIQP